MIIRKHIDTTITASGPQKIVRGLILLGMVLMMGTMEYMIIERWQLNGCLESSYHV